MSVSIDVPEYTMRNRCRDYAHARSRTHSRYGKEDTHLAGLHFRALRKSAGSAISQTIHSIPQPLWRSQTVWLLDYKELPREIWHVCCSNGILFQPTSKDIGETFVTRKITLWRLHRPRSTRTKLYLGNLDARRD